MRFKSLLAALFLLLSVFILPGAPASGPSVSPVEALIRRMESRRGSWTAFKADISMQFVSPGKKQASCEGTLVYHRLDEKILLQCFNAQGERLFAFQTNDREFELDLPALKTLFRGNIFDLEDSPDIESRLRALDLYRALKPLAVPFKNTKAESRPDRSSLLKVFREPGGKLLRKIRLSPQGDALMELYYHPVSGKPVVSIHRSEFKQTEGTVFPFHLLIKANSVQGDAGGLAETVLDFKNLRFVPELSGQEFSYTPGEGTRVIEIGGLKTLKSAQAKNEPAVPVGLRSE